MMRTPVASPWSAVRRSKLRGAAAAVSVAALAVLPSRPAQADGTRFLDPIFTSFTKTSNITYGSAINDRGQTVALHLDLYEPAGDSAPDRPAIVFIHGGGFDSGNKDNTTMVDLAKQFAQRGYVTVSIDYRLASFDVGSVPNFDPRVARAQVDAQHDAQAAVRFLRASAATYRIDPRHIAAAGGSAGAATSMRVAFDNEDVGTSGSAGFSSRICAAMSLSGAVPADLVDPSDLTATIWYHGTADTKVPWLLGQRSSDAAAAAGLVTEFHSYPGAGHVDYATFKPSILTDGARFFLDNSAGTDRDCREAPAEPPGGYGSFQSAGPTRLVDTRTGLGVPAGPIGPGQTRTIKVDGWPMMPPEGAKAVALNVTAVAPTADTHLTLWPAGQPQPTASALNPGAGRTVATMAVVPIGTGGDVVVYNNSGSTDLVVDLLGWFGAPAGATFKAVAPARLLDTRDGTGTTAGPLGPGETRLVQVAGRAGIPLSGLGTAVLNVTAVAPDTESHLTLWTALGALPGSSTLNFGPGQTVANMALVSSFPTGFIAVRNNSGTTHVVIDVSGYYSTPAGPQFQAVTPVRLLDTRDGTGAPQGRLGPGQSIELDIAGNAPVPAEAVAVDLTVTAVDPALDSHLTVWPAGTDRPLASTLNMSPGHTVANHATVPVGSNGKIAIYNNSGSTDVVVDVDGWMA